ncbi:hypothetical protein [Tamaricihabitans halophyticus]|uniref:hypothetical protein n=1 Tax=Tamaricihabitans halophyticus TaxID=1262583 RepID=UPI0014044283|nr:hypothetical protein [Tamaricihabitans halophyticus]
MTGAVATRPPQSKHQLDLDTTSAGSSTGQKAAGRRRRLFNWREARSGATVAEIAARLYLAEVVEALRVTDECD